AMVAGQHRDAFAWLQALLAPGVCECVAALVELLVAERPALVDHHGTITVTNRPCGDRTGEQSEALKSQQQLGNAMGQLGAHDAAAHAQSREISLVAEPLDQLGGATDERLGIS